MSKTAIVTDSTAWLPSEMVDRYGITVVPLNVIFGNQSFKEGVDLTTENFYKELQTQEKLPTTSQPAVGEFVEVYEELAEDFERVISIHISSGISGTINSAQSAASMVDNLTIDIVDSEISSVPQGHMAIEAAQMVEQGVPHEQILERLQQIVREAKAYFVADDLSHLHRGGRLNSAQLVLGSMLKIKPVLHFQDKKIVPFEKIRTKKKAKVRIAELFDQEAGDADQPLTTHVIHANIPGEAEEWKHQLQERYPHVQFGIADCTPVLASHVGEGLIALTWYRPEKHHNA